MYLQFTCVSVYVKIGSSVSLVGFSTYDIYNKISQRKIETKVVRRKKHRCKAKKIYNKAKLMVFGTHLADFCDSIILECILL